MEGHPNGHSQVNGSQDHFPGVSQEVSSTQRLSELKEETECRDWGCLALFLFLSLCMWTLSGWSYFDGDPTKLQRGWDIYGYTCDHGLMKGRPYTYFPSPLDGLDVSICLAGCPVVTAEESICLYDAQGLELSDYGCYNSYPSKPFFNMYCLPSDYHQRKVAIDWLYSSGQVMSRVVGDLARAWDILAIASLITGAIMVVYLIVFRTASNLHLVAVSWIFILTIPVMLFLMAVLCYLVYEESWRVDGKICDSFGPVEMETCDEGETANGYRGLSGFVIAVSFCVAVGIALLSLKFTQGIGILHQTAKIYRKDIVMHGCVVFILVTGVVFYAYFITLLIYQVSCGDNSWQIEPLLLQGQVNTWSFDDAERVLVFFDVGMILWYFSFFVHAVEYVSANAAKQWIFGGSKSPFDIKKAIIPLFRYHLGSILLASVVLPIGRLPRNLLSGLKSLVTRTPLGFFKYMTSDGLSYQAIAGGSYFQACRNSYQLYQRQEHSKAANTLNAGNSIIWLYQLLLVVVAPVFVLYWVQHKALTFRGKSTKEISSVIAMGFYVLFFSWFLGGLFAGFVRGLMHGSVLAYFVDLEVNPGNRATDVDFSMFMSSPVGKVPTLNSLDIVAKKRDSAPPPITGEDPSKEIMEAPVHSRDELRAVPDDDPNPRHHPGMSQSASESAELVDQPSASLSHPDAAQPPMQKQEPGDLS